MGLEGHAAAPHRAAAALSDNGGRGLEWPRLLALTPETRMRLPTLTVDRDGQPVVINASDFDPRRERLWGQAEPATQAPQAAEADDREALLAALAEHGIKPHGRTGTDKLRAMLEEARARAIVVAEPEG